MVEISASASVQINGQRLFQPLPRDEGNLLLSYAQQRLLFLDQLERLYLCLHVTVRMALAMSSLILQGSK